MSHLGKTTGGKTIPGVGHKTYTTRHRMPKWNITPTAMHEPKILKRMLPDWSSEDHAEAAEAHERAKERAKEKHFAAVDAAEAAYGDQGPLVSGGLREHWPASVKEKVRKLAHLTTAHSDAEHAHRKAARFRAYSPRPYVKGGFRARKY